MGTSGTPLPAQDMRGDAEEGGEKDKDRPPPEKHLQPAH